MKPFFDNSGKRTYVIAKSHGFEIRKFRMDSIFLKFSCLLVFVCCGNAFAQGQGFDGKGFGGQGFSGNPAGKQSTTNPQGGSFQNGNSLGGLPSSDSSSASGSNLGGQPVQRNQRFQGDKFGAPDSFPRVANNPNQTNPKSAVGREFKPGKVVAEVGGYPIFRGDVIADINQLIEAHMASAPESVKEQQREMALPIAVDRAIEQKLLYVDALRSLPDPSKLPELKQSIRDQFTELRLPDLLKNLKVKNPAEAELKLRKLGTSLRQAREAWVDGQLAGYFIRDKITINPEVSHFELLEYYNANRDDYHFPAKVRWEQIMVRFDKFDTKEQAWEYLGKLGNEVVYGANFNAVAKKSSHGYEASKGGYNDWTTKGSLVHEKVDEALFSMPVNQLSDRIPSKVGFHIIRVIERKNEGFTPFSKCQKEITKKILAQKQNGALKEYVEKLKKEIPYEKFLTQTAVTAK